MDMNFGAPISFGQLQLTSSGTKSLTSMTGRAAVATSGSGAGGLIVAEALKEVLGSVTDYLKTVEVEKTKRTAIRAQRDVSLSKIRAQRKKLSKIIDYTFAERAAWLENNFEKLDEAIARGDSDMVKALLDASVKIVQSSPFETIQDMQQALGSEDFVVRLE